MNLWHEHDDGFVGTHTHALVGINEAEFEHEHTDDRAVVTAGNARWKQPKGAATGETVTLDVQSTQQGVVGRLKG